MSAVAPPASRVVAARRARKRRAVRTGWNLVGLAVLVIMVFPVYWMISTAFKPDDEVNSLKPTWFPLGATLSHFRQAISGADHPFFWNSVVNSLIIVGVTVAVSIALAFLAAVALAKFRFTGRKVFIVLMIGIQMLPQTGLIIPLATPIPTALPTATPIPTTFRRSSCPKVATDARSMAWASQGSSGGACHPASALPRRTVTRAP